MLLSCFCSAYGRDRLTLMALHVTPELEAKLEGLAQPTHGDKSELLEEAVNNLVGYSQCFARRVEGSIATADHGQCIADDEVRAWIEQRERS